MDQAIIERLQKAAHPRGPWKGPDPGEAIWQTSLGDYSANSPGVTVSNNANMAVYSNAADITKAIQQPKSGR